jgi:hypothetical protein
MRDLLGAARQCVLAHAMRTHKTRLTGKRDHGARG